MRHLFSMNYTWKHRLERSAFLIGAILLHLLVFLMVATWIIFRAPPTPQDITFVGIPPPKPPPPAPPPMGTGSPAMSSLEPDIHVTPPPAVPSVISTTALSPISIKATHVNLPNLPASLSSAQGASLEGVGNAGVGSSAGSPFGSQSSNGAPDGQLIGYMIDIKQTTDGKSTDMTTDEYHKIVTHFLESHWDPEILAPYYQCKRPLYAKDIFIPTMPAAAGPKAFGVEDEVKPKMWVVWYKTTITPTVDGTYRFAGWADDIIAVSVDGQTVMDGCLVPASTLTPTKIFNYHWSAKNASRTWYGQIKAGTAVQFKAGTKVEVDVLIGEQPGGDFNAFLYCYRDDATYDKTPDGLPILPAFQLDNSPIPKDGVHPPVADKPEVF